MSKVQDTIRHLEKLKPNPLFIYPFHIPAKLSEEEELARETYINERTTKIKEHDVIFGRGGGANWNPGNIAYRKFIVERKGAYYRTKRTDRLEFALSVVREWRNMDPPGRFVKKDASVDPPVFYDVGVGESVYKTAQSLREHKNQTRLLERLNNKQQQQQDMSFNKNDNNHDDDAEVTNTRSSSSSNVVVCVTEKEFLHDDDTHNNNNNNNPIHHHHAAAGVKRQFIDNHYSGDGNVDVTTTTNTTTNDEEEQQDVRECKQSRITTTTTTVNNNKNNNNNPHHHAAATTTTIDDAPTAAIVQNVVNI